ncbi:probable monogalactosyldiacylglycerol synthase 2, chloroplastic isoform X2 [Phoenix dactylifera]|uniref:monogalactosyldiacylglycerol synthase n=1 Tax=Phoenix dactylifera TaxID=42345 RepID=A0A8B8J410_PHODC|nr:probable monogalactosyldiacylglycerol synthase 2, chloroplastic isoform X2 [Phoenix dactylifera]
METESGPRLARNWASLPSVSFQTILPSLVLSRLLFFLRAMVRSVVAPRRSIREAVHHSVFAYKGGGGGGKQQPRRCSFYVGAAGGSGGDEDGAAAWGAEDECTMELVQLGADRPKNVLVLMSDTGGGHRASAEAIRDAFRLEFGDEYRVFVKDLGKEHAGWPLNDMERAYKFMTKHVSLWKVAFHSTYPRWVHCSYLAALAAFYARKVEAGLMKYKPDIIISVHPLMQHIPLWVLKWQSLQKRVVFVTVITDLNTCHPTWFHAGVNRCYCPSEEVSNRALLEGLKPSQIRVFGLPIRPSFCRAVLNKDDLREELEMDPHLPAVLLMGGGEGMGPVKKTAMALGEALFDEELGKPIGQIVAVCGRNQILSSTLQSIKWRVPVKIRGFETQMEKWMGACDCIITKAGPGTIAEALIRGLPIILNDFIPGQEVGNIPYVVDNGAGLFSKSPKETASLVARWFGPDRDELKKFSRNALKLAQPGAVFDIVKDIHQLLVQQRGPMAGSQLSLRHL